MSAESGSYRPLPPELLYLDKDRWSAVIEEQPVHLATGFHEPESDRVLDCGVDAPRDFTPERTAQADVYEAVAAHIAQPHKARKRVVLESYRQGSLDRLQGLLAEHGLKRIVRAE